MSEGESLLLGLICVGLGVALIASVIHTCIFWSDTDLMDENGYVEGFWRKYVTYLSRLSTVRNKQSPDPFCSGSNVGIDLLEYRCAGVSLLILPILTLWLIGVIIRWVVPALMTSIVGGVLLAIIVSCLVLWFVSPYVLAIVGGLGTKLFSAKDKLDKLVNVVDTPTE